MSTTSPHACWSSTRNTRLHAMQHMPGGVPHLDAVVDRFLLAAGLLVPVNVQSGLAGQHVGADPVKVHAEAQQAGCQQLILSGRPGLCLPQHPQLQAVRAGTVTGSGDAAACMHCRGVQLMLMP